MGTTIVSSSMKKKYLELMQAREAQEADDSQGASCKNERKGAALESRTLTEDVLKKDVSIDSAETEIRTHFAIGLQQLNELPTGDKRTLLFELRSAIWAEIEKIRPTVIPLPDPDPTGNSYPLYVKNSDPVEHFVKVWGKGWIRRFNDELDRDYLFQDEMRKRDPALLKALANRLPRIGQKLSDYLSAGYVRNTLQAAEEAESARERDLATNGATSPTSPTFRQEA